ncbi:MAG: DUF2505 domain-containing protein [Gammaproteobacteria bacterium]
MSTTVEAVHEYDHPVEKVFAAFTDPDFYLAKFEGIGSRHVEVIACSDEDGVFSIETSREVPLDVPSALKAIVGAWTTLIQNEEWVTGDDDDFLNELDMTSDGMPAKMSGNMVLYATEDGGCVNEVTIRIDCSIPLLGGRLEKFIGESTREQLQAEHDFIQAYLDEID